MCASLVSWNSNKHIVVSRSLIGVEFRALTHTVVEIMLIQKVCIELQIPTSSSPLILCDNVNAQCLANHLVLHSKTKHVKIYFHFVSEKFISGSLVVEYTSSQEQIYDILTKPLASSRFVNLKTKLSVLCRT